MRPLSGRHAVGGFKITTLDRGGHFAYTTDPDLVAGDLREFFADLG